MCSVSWKFKVFMRAHARPWCMLSGVVAGLSLVGSASGSFAIFGGPAYDSTTLTGFKDPYQFLFLYAPYSGRSTAGNGVAVGYANKYIGGTFLGSRAVRWDASGTAATELGNLGANSSGITYSSAYAINSVGTAVGFARKYDGSGTFLGDLAVRWDASGTAATELGNLGTDSSGITFSSAYAINPVGTAVGYADKYISGISYGSRAVRWDASGTAATELGNLGTDSSGITLSEAYAINSVGTAVGAARKYDGSGTFLGFRAVRWDASGTAATELGNLGTDSSGYTFSQAYAINSTGITVGLVAKYIGGVFDGYSAVAWGLDGVAIDLNTLLSSADAALWKLTIAFSISDTNWVTGIGTFDPDGPGGIDAYNRAFLMQIPEPTLLGVVGTAGLLALHRRRRGA